MGGGTRKTKRLPRPAVLGPAAVMGCLEAPIHDFRPFFFFECSRSASRTLGVSNKHRERCLQIAQAAYTLRCRCD